MATSAQQTIHAGGHLPHITLPSLTGEPINLKAFHGRKLVMFCWASW